MNLKNFMPILAAVALAGCDAAGQPAPLPTVVLGAEAAAAPAQSAPAVAAQRAGAVTASGVVIPASHAVIASTVPERVKALAVAEGDEVAAGDVLVQLDDEAAQAQLAGAEAALAVAQANYDLLAAGPTSEQVRQAEAAVLAATAAYSRTAGGPRAADVAAAQAAYDAAQTALQAVQAGPQPEDVAAAQAALQSAEAAVRQAQAKYDDAYRRDPAGIGASPAALALEQATAAFNAAKATYDKAVKPAGAAQLAVAQQQVESARAALERARTPARGYDLAQARAQIDEAQAGLDALRAGPRAQQLAAAVAQIAAARAQVRAAEAQLHKLTLTSPITGTVTRIAIHEGEAVTPGQAVLVVANLRQLQVETTDLSELDVVKISPGQAATVVVEALGQRMPGKVIAVASEADTLGGDVVYRAVIALEGAPAGIRPGMSADVEFGA